MQPEARPMDSDDRWYEALGAAILAPECPKGLAGIGGDAARFEAGLRIYRNNVRSAYGRALGDLFPVIRRLVGEDFFKALAAAFFAAHRPRARRVARYGDPFPQFLEKFPPVAHLPYLADVARLELLWLAAYHSRDATPLSAGAAMARGGAAPENLRLLPHASLQLFATRTGALSIWRHNKLERTGPLSVSEPCEWALIARPDTEVRVIAVSKAVHDCVAALAGGALLGEALETALAVEPQAEPAAILQTIFEAGAILDASLER